MRDNNMEQPPEGNNLPKGYKNILCLREWFRDTEGQNDGRVNNVDNKTEKPRRKDISTMSLPLISSGS